MVDPVTSVQGYRVSTQDQLNIVLNKPVYFSSSLAKAQGDVSIAVGSAALSENLSKYIEGLFAIARSNPAYARLFDAVLSGAGLPTLDQLDAAYQTYYAPYVDAANDLIDPDYIDFQAEIQADATDIQTAGESFDNILGSNVSYIDSNGALQSVPFRDVPAALAAYEQTGDASSALSLYNAMKTQHNALANPPSLGTNIFNSYNQSIASLNNAMANSGLNLVAWNAYLATVAAIDPPGTIIIPPPLPPLPSDYGTANSYTPPLSVNMPDTPIIDIFTDGLDAANAAIANLQNASQSVNGQTVVENILTVPTITPFPTSQADVIGAAAATGTGALADIGLELLKLLSQFIPDQEEIDFNVILTLLKAASANTGSWSLSGAGSSVGAGLALTSTQANLIAAFGLSLSKRTLEFIREASTLDNFDINDLNTQVQLQKAFAIAGKTVSFLAAAVTLIDLQNSGIDLNIVSADVVVGLLALNTLKLFSDQALQAFLSSGADLIKNEALALGTPGSTALDLAAQKATSLVAKTGFGLFISGTAEDVGLPSSFTPAYLTTLYAQAIGSNPVNAGLLSSLFTQVGPKVSFSNLMSLAAVKSLLGSAFNPSIVSPEQAQNIENALYAQAQSNNGTVSLADLQSVLTQSLPQVSVADVNAIALDVVNAWVQSELENNQRFNEIKTERVADQRESENRVKEIFNGEVRQNFVSLIDNNLVRSKEGVVDKTSLDNMVAEEKAFFEKGVLPPAWKYYQKLQEPGMQFLANSLFINNAASSTQFGPTQRNAIHIAT